ncbi:MAG: hypothetical protein WCJ18_09855, partial [Planctomycetota bacterium]
MIGIASFTRGLKRGLACGGLFAVAAACGGGLLVLPAAAQDPAAAIEAGPLRFRRVHVPRGGLAAVPLG